MKSVSCREKANSGSTYESEESGCNLRTVHAHAPHRTFGRLRTHMSHTSNHSLVLRGNLHCSQIIERLICIALCFNLSCFEWFLTLC